MEKLNESWHVFVLLALGFAFVVFFIHRRLLKRESIKVDFGAANRKKPDQTNDKMQIISRQNTASKRNIPSSSEEDDDPQQAVHKNQKSSPAV